MASMNGTIKRLVGDKGFGFILAADGLGISFTIRPANSSLLMIFEKGKQSRSIWERAKKGQEARTSGSPELGWVPPPVAGPLHER